MCAMSSSFTPPLMGKRDLLEWAAHTSGVHPCRQYDDLRDGLVLLSLAHTVYPSDVPSRFLRVQKRAGQPREATKNWQLLLRCLDRHGIPLTLCTHEKISKGNARCCFNALVLFFFLCSLSASPGATLSVRFSSPVDPRLIQFLQSPQGQRAVQPPQSEPFQRAGTSDTSRGSAARLAVPCAHTHSQARSVHTSVLSACASSEDVDHEEPRENVKDAMHAVLDGARHDHNTRTEPLPRRHRSEDSTRASLPETDADTRLTLLSAELEHVKAMAQLALSQQAVRAELQSHLLRSEAAQMKLECEYAKTTHAVLMSSAHGQSGGDSACVGVIGEHARDALEAHVHALEHALEGKQRQFEALAHTVEMALTAQISVCRSVLALPRVNGVATCETGEKDVEEAAEAILDTFIPLLGSLTLPRSSGVPETAWQGLQSCLHILVTSLHTLQLENTRLKRCQSHSESEEMHNSQIARHGSNKSATAMTSTTATLTTPQPEAQRRTAHMTDASVLSRLDLAQRLELAVEEQAHEIATLRGALRRTQEQLSAVNMPAAETRTRSRSRRHRTGSASLTNTTAANVRTHDSVRDRHAPEPCAATAPAPRDCPRLPSSASAAVAPPRNESLFMSAEELEQRTAALLHKYSTLVAAQS